MRERKGKFMEKCTNKKRVKKQKGINGKMGKSHDMKEKRVLRPRQHFSR